MTCGRYARLPGRGRIEGQVSMATRSVVAPLSTVGGCASRRLKTSTDTMSVEASHDQSFRIERHGEVAVVIPSPKVEEMHETLIAQAAKMVVDSLKEDPPAGIVIDLSQVNFVGSVFVSFLLRCHMLAKEQVSEIVLAGASEPA